MTENRDLRLQTLRRIDDVADGLGYVDAQAFKGVSRAEAWPGK